MSTITGETNNTNTVTVTQAASVHRSASNDTVTPPEKIPCIGRDVQEALIRSPFSNRYNLKHLPTPGSDIVLHAGERNKGSEVAYIAEKFIARGYPVSVEDECTRKLLVDNGVPASSFSYCVPNVPLDVNQGNEDEGNNLSLVLSLLLDTTSDVQPGTLKPHTSLTQPHPSPSSHPPLVNWVWDKEEGLPYAMRCFELWISANPNHQNPLTGIELEWWTQAVVSHIQFHEEMRERDRKQDKIERVLRHFWGFYQFRTWVLGKHFRAYEERRAKNLKHKEECRWCRQAIK
ncbi:hypothetical protein HK104_005553 [Borealophlyctis nickersoniae]|nr:hypothetical protein HK104_005553 [Borealophlyctis nickersoniae]